MQSVTLIAAICVLSQAFLPLGRFIHGGDEAAPGDSDPWTNLLQLFVLAVMLAGCARHKRRIADTLRAGFLQWPVWIYCLCSAGWSGSPGTTLRRSMLLLAYFVFGHYACASVGAGGTIRRLSAAGTLMLVLSLALFVAAPGLGQDTGDYQGALRGVFVQKNLTAWAFQLALACMGYRFYAERRVGWGFLVRVAAIVGAIVLTRSTTQLLGCVVLLGFWAWSGWFRAARVKAVPVWVAACALAIAGWTLWGLGDEAYRVLGKDSTLTGRGPIWEMAERAIAARPWFGWGFQGFWQPDERAVQEIWAVVGWLVPHAHNGLLELLLETGIVGAALFALLAGNLVVLVARGIARDEALAWWTASWMILVALKAHAEPVYLQLDLSTALLSFSTVALGMRERELLLQARAARASATAWRAGLAASASS